MPQDSPPSPAPPSAPDGDAPEATLQGPACLPPEEAGAMLQAILTGIRAGAVILDPTSFTVTELNGVAEELFAIRRQDVIGRNYRELSARLTPLEQPSPGPQTREQDDMAFAGGEFLLARPGGKSLPVSRTILNASVGGKRRLIDILFDISEKKTMERELGLARKLEAIGQLASGIAHEINTPVQYVGGNLSFLNDAFTDLAGYLARLEALGDALRDGRDWARLLEEADKARGELRVQELLDEIPGAIADSLTGVDRVAVIVGAMRTFSHPGQAERRLVDVNRAVEATLVIARNEWKYDADVETDLDPELPLLPCSPGDFNQALLNVVVNAAHAVSERFHGSGAKGVIRISTARDGDWMEITVGDTGVGIPRENLERIFDPFFTTKEVGKGTGQGLAIVHSVVSRHGGAIRLDSTPGEGTRFTLRFPLGREGAAA
ncbi:Sensor protein ZraS [Fundidesulfovibrio magnetotacticus]|uniref:histidine kinase n=1 Tax=Fundidesulfovibrio magnetotacticus TaxID=2730080 RepID=A0A6V8M452_9BACT|nr:ATP-binding protein [Fundidesulfovibrio magnetotacticus]GFK95185.1 Sensor protein ZraS [Fundidesulfovibrio magnetotacticus]